MFYRTKACQNRLNCQIFLICQNHQTMLNCQTFQHYLNLQNYPYCLNHWTVLNYQNRLTCHNCLTRRIILIVFRLYSFFRVHPDTFCFCDSIRVVTVRFWFTESIAWFLFCVKINCVKNQYNLRRFFIHCIAEYSENFFCEMDFSFI